MPFLKMLIGLPGSGKSTYAKKRVESEAGWIHLSSDEISKQKFSMNEPVNLQIVFSELYHQTACALEEGLNVIYDATNLSSKKRRSFLNRIQKLEAETEAVLFLTPYSVLKERNRQRGDVDRVPDYVVERYIKGFQFPRQDEGFNKITILHSHPIALSHAQQVRQKIGSQDVSYQEFLYLYGLFEETKPLLELDSVTSYSYELFNAVRKKLENPLEREVLSWTALLHCIGKAYVRKNLPLEEDNFHGYEHASWYLAYPILSALGFPSSFIFDVLSIIDEHVEAQTVKQGRLKRRMGMQNYERLQLLLASRY